MRIQEKEIVELYRAMETAAATPTSASKPPLKSEVIAILTAVRVLKRVMEKCCIEICGAIEQSRPELKLTLHQANAIIDMDNHGYSEGLGPETKEACQGWGELLSLAETIMGQTANANLSDDQITAREIVDEVRKAAYHKSQAEARRDFGDMTPPSGGRMV